MHLLNMPRPTLLAAMGARLPRRYQRWLEEGDARVRVAGVFKPTAARWYIAVQIKRARRVSVWVRMYEVRRQSDGKHQIIVVADQPPVWRQHVAESIAGDCYAAVRRLAQMDARSAAGKEQGNG